MVHILLLLLSIKSMSQTIEGDSIRADSITTIKLPAIVISSTSDRFEPIQSFHMNRIDSRELTFIPSGEITTALNLTPGVFIHSGAINTNRIVIRGIGSRTPYGTNKIRAYIDEIPVTGGVGETMINQFNPADMESVDVIKGPSGTLFGANLGGAILIETVSPRSGEMRLRNQTRTGSFGLFKNSTSYSFGGEKLNLHFNYDHFERDGFRENSGYNRNSYYFKAGFSPDIKNKIEFIGYSIAYRAFIASSLGKTAFDANPQQADKSWREAQGYEQQLQQIAALKYTHWFNPGFSSKTILFVKSNDHDEPRPFNIRQEQISGFGLRTLLTKKISIHSKSAAFNAGGELYSDRSKWKTIENLYKENAGAGSKEGNLLSDNMENRTQFHIFGTFRYEFTERVTAEAGLHFSKNHYDYSDLLNKDTANQSGERNFEPVLSPKIMGSYRIATDKYLFAGISFGYNYPGLEESLTPTGTVNPEIGPEKGWSFETGTDLWFLTKTIHLKINIYRMEIKGLLVAERVGEDQYIGKNAGQTSHTGIEITNEYQLWPGRSLSLTPYINASVNLHYFEDFVDEEIDYSGNKLTGVPAHYMQGGFNLAAAIGLFLKTEFLYTGKIPVTDANDLYTDPYLICNAEIGYEKELFKKLNVRASFGIQNLLDERYASSVLINAVAFGGNEPRYYYPGAPRNHFISLALDYKF
jgi:iron complex outermembrane recepter protein